MDKWSAGENGGGLFECDTANGDNDDDVVDMLDDVTYGDGGGDGNVLAGVFDFFMVVSRDDRSFVNPSPQIDEAEVGIDAVVVVISVVDPSSMELLW